MSAASRCRSCAPCDGFCSQGRACPARIDDDDRRQLEFAAGCVVGLMVVAAIALVAFVRWVGIVRGWW